MKSLGRQNVTVSLFEDVSSGIGVWKRTIYARTNGTFAMRFSGKLREVTVSSGFTDAEGDEDWSYHAVVDLRTKRTRRKRQ